MIASLLSRFGRLSSRLALASALAMALGLSPLLPSGPAQAYESRYVYKADGSPLFELRFFDEGEQYYMPNGSDDYISPWTLPEEQKNGIVEAARHWADVLGSASRNTSPLVINIGTINVVGNAATSCIFNDRASPVIPSAVQESIISGTPMEYPALIEVGILDSFFADHLSPLPSQQRATTISPIFCTMNWGTPSALALWPTIIKTAAPWNRFPYGTRTLWTSTATGSSRAQALFRKARPTAWKGRSSSWATSQTAAYASTASTFPKYWGKATACSSTAMRATSPSFRTSSLSTVFMSHQLYRNYTTFMEAELAALQDLGYNFDRKNYYGFSVYADGQTMVNKNGYFARNAEGTAYLYGVPNTATLGVGLHVYGKNNTIVQAADLLACGTAGTGIRVDGSANNLTIAPGVRIAANGSWGTGLLVAYGKNHTVISRGDITALGKGGIAARFDFGNNLISNNDMEYRGSWLLWGIGYYPPAPIEENVDWSGFPLNLNGPLISRFDVSGLLAGTDASIFISENALVKDINVLSGAQLVGDIVSEWNPNNEYLLYPGDRKDLYTALNFGHAANADGTAGAPDSSFNMTLFGSVDGARAST